MKTQIIAIVSLLAVVACGDDGAETTTSTTSSTTTLTTETGTTLTTETGTTVTTDLFSPNTGVWRVTNTAFTKNECNLESGGKQLLAFNLISVDDSTFVLVDMDDLDINFECTNTGDLKAYTCSSAVLSDSFLPDMDAVVESVIAPEVMFSSNESAEMPFVFTADCVGKDCVSASKEMAMPFPCQTVGSFELNVPTGPTP